MNMAQSLNNRIKASLPPSKNTAPIMDLSGTIQADQQGDLMLGKKLNDIIRQQGAIGGHRKVQVFTL